PARLGERRLLAAWPREAHRAVPARLDAARRVRDRSAATARERLARLLLRRAHHPGGAPRRRVSRAARHARPAPSEPASARRDGGAPRARPGPAALPRRARASGRRSAQGDPLEVLRAPADAPDQAVRARDEPRRGLPRERRLVRAVLDPG